MNIVKKIMLAIIAIQVMVTLELVVVKYGNLENSFHKVVKVFDFNLKLFSSTSTLVQLSSIEKDRSNIINVSFSKEQKEFAKLMTLGLGDKIKEFSLSVGQYTSFTNRELNFEKQRKLESQAKKFLGIRYVWGATGPDKFDCSGFTQKVYKIAGIKLPRHSTRQAMVGEYIKYKDLQRGDMVFFDTSKKHKGIVNHVGIYLEDGKFIHASSGKKKVVITSFDKKKFYKNRFLWGRRIIKEKLTENPSLNKKVMSLLSFATHRKQNKFPS